MTVNIGINGLGRIGRCVLRAYFENNYPDINLVALNVSTKIEDFINLIKYDSAHGKFNADISLENGALVINNKKIKIYSGRDPENIPWDNDNIDVVLECTGAFKSKELASKYLKSSIKRVIISAPSNDADATIVMGVNDDTLKSEHRIISAGSCTTNALAPIAKVINDNFGIESGYMTTIHAYTNDQNIVDNRHKDARRARSAAMSMIPTSTGAAKTIGKILPDLSGKLSGSAIRVPTPNVSVVDLVVNTAKDCTIEEVNQAMISAANSDMKNILGISDEELVSIDFNHRSESSIFDIHETSVTNKNLLRVISWYDNEWGFSCRMLDLASKLIEYK